MKMFFRIIFCFFTILAKSQESDDKSTLEIKYNFTYVADTLNKSDTISEPMVLLTNGKKSIYYSENDKTFADGFSKQLDNAIKTGSIVDPSKLPKARVRYSVYKDNDSIYVSNFLGRDRYTYSFMESIKWIIDNSEFKNISGYKCFKAIAKIGNRHYVAWFTYDIPISDGPYKFKGLPGLILKLNDKNNYFTFELLSITKINLPIIYKKGIMLTEKQYVMKRNEYIKDPFQGKIKDLEYRKRLEKNKKKYNNYLEN